MAERIAWLGNDETHWYRQWEDKGIEDLKDLIRISVAYIESEYLFDKYRDEMPAGKK